MHKYFTTCIKPPTDKPDHGLSHIFRSARGCCKWFEKHKECVVEVSFHFQMELNTLTFLSAPTFMILKDWNRANGGGGGRERGACNWSRSAYTFVTISITKSISHRSAKMRRKPIVREPCSYFQKHIWNQP